MTRQTVSFLKRRFEEVGIEPQTRHGQNFLIDLNLVELLADAAELTGRDVVLEVGTGTGSLSALIAERAAALVTVEIDPRLHQLAAEQLARFENIVMLRQDALKNKNRMHPQVLAAVQEQLEQDPERRFKLVANLPFNVATPVIANLLTGPQAPALMAVTVQRELAERIVALPSTRDYSALSVWVQSQCDVEILRVLSPSVFWPRPQVESAFIKVVPQPAKRARIPDLDFFHEFVRAMFFHRRKLLRRELQSAFKHRLDKREIDELLEELGLAADTRAEQMTPDQFLQLSDAARRKLPP